jgi:hypothetical protein
MASMPPQTGAGPSSLLNDLGSIGSVAPIATVNEVNLEALIAQIEVPKLPPPTIDDLPNPCADKINNKIEINQEDTLVVNTKRIKELTQQIRSTVDCDALKLIVKQHLDDIKKAAKAAVKEQLELLKQYLPITSLPSPTPWGIVKWLGRFVTGTVIPQLEAFIKYTVEILGLIKAVTELIKAVEEVIPRLKACAIQIYQETKADLKNEINQAVKTLEKKISGAIAKFICQGIGASGIQALGDAVTAFNLVEDTLKAAKELKNTLVGDANNSLGQISQAQTQVQGITGIPPAIATDSLENFEASVNSGAFETYKAQNEEFVNTLPPVNDELPVASGYAIVGNTVTCNTGVWTSNAAMTYSAQWYREGNPIYNANSFTYSPSIDDIDLNIYCQVVGENKAGYIEVKSNEVGPVVYSVPAANLPVISGSLSVGSTLQCSTGVWAGFTPTKYDYQWFRGTNMVSSSNNSYVITYSDIGSQIKCKVIASSARYTLAIDSDPVTIP